jgi:bacterioferritin
MPSRDQRVLRLLDEALATELVSVLQYKRHHFTAATLGGIAGFAVANELANHAVEEQAHADRIAERIVQLGGEPNFNSEGLSARSRATYVAGRNLIEMLEADLVGERAAIDLDVEIVCLVGGYDSTTRRMMEDILAQDEEHADELEDFLQHIRVGRPA